MSERKLWEKTITVTYKLRYSTGVEPYNHDAILCGQTDKIVRTGVYATAIKSVIE